MKHNKFNIDGPIEIFPDIFKDDRGSFHESFNSCIYRDLGIESNFVQDNHSISKKNVFRGIHLQSGAAEQGKLVRVVSGKAMDYVVDLRPKSPTYKEYISVLLEPNFNQLWIPRGFGHAFLSLEDNTNFLYKTDNFYNKNSEVTLKWNDPIIGIDLGGIEPIVSSKDQEGLSFNEINQIIVS